jgi:tRNA(Leu) C34 or U34 (ribose-2'-O)-methylase TrmL
MTRGFSCVALNNPKDPKNIGAVLRAAHVYEASLVVLSGKRFTKVSTDTTKAWRHIPLVQIDDVFEAIPYDCVPIAVDLVDGAVPLPGYCHPERAFYVFGAEDQTLGKSILDRCRDRIMVPTKFCMNLAASVNVILYDRMAKQALGNSR